MMSTIIGTIVVVVILGCAIMYIVKQKKKGAKCIGCPSECNCSSSKSCSCEGDCNDEVHKCQ